ncbi:MAG: hypothetical protein K9L59_10090 [Desulfobacterales bacterium]|nr:hypothetical protein [Desulfobacterales bacterium]
MTEATTDKLTGDQRETILRMVNFIVVLFARGMSPHAFLAFCAALSQFLKKLGLEISTTEIERIPERRLRVN